MIESWRSQNRIATAPSDGGSGWGAPALFMALGVVYNAILAFLNAHGLYVGQSMVVATEGVIVLGAVGYMLTRMGEVGRCTPVLLFQFVMLALFLWVTILSDFLNVKAFRDIFLVTVFTLLGTLSSRNALVRTYIALTILTFVVLLMEAYATDIYAAIFNPASYYANTRDLANPEFNESGIFVNALSFEGRFSLGGLLNIKHRLSSIFIEQVSLGNFAIILTIFTSVFWSVLGRKARVFMLGTICLILIGNNSRTAFALCSVVLAGHFVFPRLPRYSHFVYLPLSLCLVVFFFHMPECIQNGGPFLVSDDLTGRLSLASCTLKRLTIGSLIGAESANSRIFWDSGYVYFINAQSAMGLIVLWLFCSMVIKPTSPDRMRMLHYLAWAIFINMYTSMALFSIKVAAPIWFMVGYIYQQQQRKCQVHETE